MEQILKYRLVGTVPLLMHNGTLSDPLNPWSREIKAISGKKVKTDADHEEIGRLEWFGSLYLDEGHLVIPAKAIKATITNAAKALKKGRDAKAAFLIPAHAPLLYDGPDDPEDLWEQARFRYRTNKFLRSQQVIRTRPIFFPWSADVTMHFNDEMFNKDTVDQLWHIAGHIIGLLEERPEYGRFEAQRL